MLMPNTLGTGKAAKLLGVSVKTLQRWDREGGLIPVAKGSKRHLYPATPLGEFSGLPSPVAAPCP